MSSKQKEDSNAPIVVAPVHVKLGLIKSIAGYALMLVSSDSYNHKGTIRDTLAAFGYGEEEEALVIVNANNDSWVKAGRKYPLFLWTLDGSDDQFIALTDRSGATIAATTPRWYTAAPFNGIDLLDLPTDPAYLSKFLTGSLVEMGLVSQENADKVYQFAPRIVKIKEALEKGVTIPDSDPVYVNCRVLLGDVQRYDKIV